MNQILVVIKGKVSFILVIYISTKMQFGNSLLSDLVVLRIQFSLANSVTANHVTFCNTIVVVFYVVQFLRKFWSIIAFATH